MTNKDKVKEAVEFFGEELQSMEKFAYQHTKTLLALATDFIEGRLVYGASEAEIAQAIRDCYDEWHDQYGLRINGVANLAHALVGKIGKITERGREELIDILDKGFIKMISSKPPLYTYDNLAGEILALLQPQDKGGEK